MSRKKRKKPDNPKPLNFDDDKGTGDYLKKPFRTPEDARGDTEDYQYHEKEESLSPEEVKNEKKKALSSGKTRG